MHPLHAAVDGLMRRIGRNVLMAHFQKLGAGDIAEKAPDDYVTIADTQSEAQLIEGLTALIDGSHVVGEEGVAANPALVAEATRGPRGSSIRLTAPAISLPAARRLLSWSRWRRAVPCRPAGSSIL